MNTMAFGCTRLYFKYVKCLFLTIIIAFFTQLYVAIKYFPSESENTFLKDNGGRLREKDRAISSLKFNGVIIDEAFRRNKDNIVHKNAYLLRVDELDFKPICDINSREAISAIHRAKTQGCKQQITNKTCLIQSGQFYPKKLPNSCPQQGMTYGKHLGCYQDEKKMRLLTSFYGNYATTNSPNHCLDICVQAGFSYAGVQYATECFCGEFAPLSISKIDDAFCNMKCPGDATQTCGGYFTMNVYETGLPKFSPQVPKTIVGNEISVKIVFLLTLNGRALRQVHRLINALYRSNHYFYIHVDARQDYLHRELSLLEKKYSNIKLAPTRYASIWGGASLLQMLLTSMASIIKSSWQWDFIINLSESDFPIKSLQSLEKFLSDNRGLNFVKSHGREVQRFIKKQGLDKTFIECDTHMWRAGDRRLPRGVIVDGGSDWVALSPPFVSYVVGEKDELLAGLDIIFRHTLLPAESFFHTALRNSKFCNTYVDNNLHVTNWKRKLGCKCQYRHVVDWCGCSPNDFRAEDWPRIQSTQDKQLFFARKFEPIINQEIITRVEQSIGMNDHHLIYNLEAYWQSIYNKNDLPASSDDLLQTHAGSVIRQNARILSEELCFISPSEIIEVNSYNYADMYKGNLILHRALIESGLEVYLETWYKPQKHLKFNRVDDYIDNIKIFKVSSDYDQKEQTFRNLGDVLGPLSEPSLLYHFSSPLDSIFSNLTVVWLDPAGVIADVTEMHVDENNLTNFIKPNLKTPLLPGIWRVGLLAKTNLIVQTKFLITPLEYFSGKILTPIEGHKIHSGSQSSYKNFSYIAAPNLLPSKTDIQILNNIAQSNIKRIDQDLNEWIDSLSSKFYNILGSCVHLIGNATDLDRLNCGKHKFELCSLTKWSSLSPDPKGHIGQLNEHTGRLERV